MGFGPRYCALTDFFSDSRGTPAASLRCDDDKFYRFVKNVTAADLVVGDVIYHGTNDPTLSEVYKLGQSAKGTFDQLMAGVAVSAIPSTYYGWIQIFGYNAAVNTLGATLQAGGDVLVGVSGQLYVTKEFTGKIYSAVAASTAITAGTITDADTNITLPANTLQVGDVIRVVAQIIANTTTGAETVTIAVRVGTTTIVTFTGGDAVNGDIGFVFVDIVVRTIGASGTMVAASVIGMGVDGTATGRITKLGSTTLDTTATQKLTVSVTNSSTGESTVANVVNIERIPANPRPQRNIISLETYNTVSAATKKGLVRCM